MRILLSHRREAALFPRTEAARHGFENNRAVFARPKALPQCLILTTPSKKQEANTGSDGREVGDRRFTHVHFTTNDVEISQHISGQPVPYPVRTELVPC